MKNWVIVTNAVSFIFVVLFTYQLYVVASTSSRVLGTLEYQTQRVTYVEQKLSKANDFIHNKISENERLEALLVNTADKLRATIDELSAANEQIDSLQETIKDLNKQLEDASEESEE